MTAKQAMARLTGQLPSDVPLGRRAKTKQAPKPTTPIETGTVHVLVKQGNKWLCIACGQQTAQLSKLKNKHCCGAEDAAHWTFRPPAWMDEAKLLASHCPLANGHSLFSSSPYLGCLACGAYGSKGKAKKLLAPCNPLSPAVGKERVLNRLLKQRHPFTSETTGQLQAATPKLIRQALARPARQASRHHLQLQQASQVRQQQEQQQQRTALQGWQWLTKSPAPPNAASSGGGRKRRRQQLQNTRATRLRA